MPAEVGNGTGSIDRFDFAGEMQLDGSRALAQHHGRGVELRRGAGEGEHLRRRLEQPLSLQALLPGLPGIDLVETHDAPPPRVDLRSEPRSTKSREWRPIKRRSLPPPARRLGDAM